MNPFNLKQHGLTVTEVHRNLSPSALYEHATCRGDSELMRKFLSPLFILLASVVLHQPSPGLSSEYTQILSWSDRRLLLLVLLILVAPTV